MMLLLLVALCCMSSHAHPGPGYSYRINQYFDEALVSFGQRVLNGEASVQELKSPLVVGGFLMTGAKLKDLSNLVRKGDAWLLSQEKYVGVFANFSLPNMSVEGEKILGPNVTILHPKIVVRENLVTAKMTAGLYLGVGFPPPTKPSCRASYSISVGRLSSVNLIGEETAVSLDWWVERFFTRLARLLDPVIRKVFDDHFDLCQPLRNSGYVLSDDGDSY